MTQSLLIAFREALQCTAILLLVRAYLLSGNEKYFFRPLLSGTVLALLAGFTLGFVPQLAKRLPSYEIWSFFGQLTDIVIFYMGFALIVLRPRHSGSVLKGAGFFLLGFSIFFFEARSLGFIMLDNSLMEENIFGILFSGVCGLALGFMPLLLIRSWFDRLRIPQGLTAVTLLIAIGAFRFAFGGLGEFEDAGVVISVNRGILAFLENARGYVQAGLLLDSHPFMAVPFTGLIDFLFGDRTAMSITVIFMTAPPLAALLDIFGKPSPLLHDIEVAAERRLSLAFFRKELVHQSVPVLLSFLIVIVLIHAMNVSLNPMYEPDPIPVRETGDEGVIRIPASGAMGDFSDGKLKKFVYFYGNKQIIFIAILKPDGAVGLALDECEICKPAEWNKAAQGYAQRGEHLVCKYCMTPIAVSTVNNPGGCNPIPLPFKLEGQQIVIEMDDLIRIYNEAKTMQKKGTHL